MQAEFGGTVRWAAAFAAVALWWTAGSGVDAQSRGNRNAQSQGNRNAQSQGDRTAPAAAAASYQVFAWNDLGMHCYDSDFSLFSLLPPFNTVHAQVVKKGSKPVLCGSNDVTAFYQGIADPSGSINTTSAGKTNFWQYSQALFGATPAMDVGLLGAAMPGLANTARPMTFDPTMKWASATGIPITCIDNAGTFNSYPMLRFQAALKGKTAALTHVDAVVPVSSEMDCKSCHANGGVAADDAHVQSYGLKLSTNNNPDPAVRQDLQSRENILNLHDILYGTKLWASRPVLCASCHYSKALDLAGAGPQGAQIGNKSESQAMHGRHGRTMDNQVPSGTNQAIVSAPGVEACYKCHPGNRTNCLRGVMAAAQVGCQNCHGELLSVGAQFGSRNPWADEPKCQSCHTGDLVRNLGGALPRTTAYTPGDPTATPTLAPASRFAENPGQLYRFSTGHGGMACSACHGSPHAEWPSASLTANDNITPQELQGHTGVIVECATCHGSSLSSSLNGPHGMHNVNSSSWVSGHGDRVEGSGIAACQACHGTGLLGSYLSKAAANRSFRIEGRTVNIAAGTAVSCTLCHQNPLNHRG